MACRLSILYTIYHILYTIYTMYYKPYYILMFVSAVVALFGVCVDYLRVFPMGLWPLFAWGGVVLWILWAPFGYGM